MTARPLEGRIALVTGASRGIGYHSALAYGAAGAHVVAVARTVGGLEELDDAIQDVGSDATLVPLDIRDTAGLDRLAPALAERFGRVDILLGNAAVLGPQTPVGHMGETAWDETLAVNLSANWRLLRGFDPLLRASDAGTALFMTSGVAGRTPAYLAAYAASKAGLEALVRSYAVETAKTAVTANLIDPGPVRTRLRARYLPGEDPSQLPGPEDVAERIVGVTLEARHRRGQTWRSRDAAWSGAAG